MRSLTLANHSNFPGLGVNEHLASSCNNFYIFVAFCSSFPKPIAFTLAQNASEVKVSTSCRQFRACQMGLSRGTVKLAFHSGGYQSILLSPSTMHFISGTIPKRGYIWLYHKQYGGINRIEQVNLQYQ